MTYVFVAVLTVLMIKFIWDLCKERVKSFGNWCWQQMKFAGGWCWRLVKDAWNWCKWCKWCIKIFWAWCKFLWKNPASLFLTLAGLLILIALVIFAPYFYKIYFVLSSQIHTEYLDAVKQAGETGEQVGKTGEQVGETGEQAGETGKQVGKKENSDSYFSISIRYFGIVAAAGAIIGYVIAIARNIISDNQNKVADEQNRINEQGRITESMVQAIAQTGAINNDKSNIAIRLGGLYSLQRIMKDSPRDEESIAKIFYAYVRENTKKGKSKESEESIPSWQKKRYPPEDVQAALDIINQFHKEWREQGRKITDDIQINFARSSFSGYSFMGVNFSNANLDNVDFSNANLTSANLTNADLSDADLTGADLHGADLYYAKNLKQDQIEKANGDEHTELPDELNPPKDWTEPEDDDIDDETWDAFEPDEEDGEDVF